MARQEQRAEAARGGRHEFLGVILLGFSVFMLLALFSYDNGDVNRQPPNDPARNWAGTWGAWLAFVSMFALGVGAHLLALTLGGIGLGCLFDRLAFFRRRWPWLALLLAATAGCLELLRRLAGWWALSAFPAGPGGLLGTVLNDHGVRFIGAAGGITLFLTLYVVSLLGLTEFQLFQWLRTWWRRRQEAREAALDEEQKLARRARELEREARRLQEIADRSATKAARATPAEAAETTNLGPDLQPVPEPTVRDHSVPQPGTRRPAPPEPADPPTPPAPPAGPEAVEGPRELVVSADEMAPGPASADEILGRPDAAKAEAEGALPAPLVHLPPRPKPRRKPVSVAAAPTIGNYRLPPLDLLQPADLTVRPTETKEELMANARLMQQTLAQFGIEVSLGDITKGPTITRYELHPAPGVKLERITALTNNIAAALKAERIHILAPVPGRSSVGVEVPNVIKTKVILRDLLESEEWTRTKARIPLCLGKDVYGHPIIADLAEMPHVLIAGSTGSGKSVCINGIIASLLYKFPPDQLRFVMIDPKVVEMQQYNTLPHLVVPVVTDPKKVVLALRWVVNEMEKRYQIFAKVGVRNIKSFNERPKSPPPRPAQAELPLGGARERIEATREGFAVQLDEEIVDEPQEEIVIPDKLSYIVVIIDELADLMLVAPADVEMAIARITQMARAAGIHCIVATQRPSVDVITGVIKSNIPARIAFQVASAVDSRTILDQKGADKLLGKGDMLYLPPGSAKLNRAQGALITDQEIQSIVDFIAVQGKPSYELEIHRQLSKPARDYGEEGAEEEDEDLIEQCIEVIRSEQKASTSLLQRRLGLGYGRAARMMDVLEDRGIVGPANGAKPRDVLIDLEGTGADGGKQELV